MPQENRGRLGLAMMAAVFLTAVLSGSGLIESPAFAATSTQSTNTVTVSNEAPAVSGAVINSGSPIILSPGVTTTIQVGFTISDANGCADVLPGGNVTTTLYRSGVGSSCAASERSCYIVATTTHDCTGNNVSANVTSTFAIYYFADATDASSSYSGETWVATIAVRDGANATSATSTAGVELNTLLALGLSTTSLNYGTVNKGTNTGSSTQESTVINMGNTSSTLKISGTAMSSGGNSMPTSSQHYATSTFTYGGVEQALSDAATTVAGFFRSWQPAGSWTETQALPYTYSSYSLNAKKNFLYITGGFAGGVSTSTVRYAPINSDGSVGSWQETTAFPGGSIGLHEGFISGDYLYVIGGSTSTARRDAYFGVISSSTGAVSNWQSTSQLPSPRDRAGSAVYNGYAYIVAGSSAVSANSTSTVYFAQINVTGSLSAWSSTTPIPGTGYSNTAAAAYEGYLYAVGGYNVTDNSGSSTIWFAPINSTGSIGSWATTTPLPYKIQQHEIAAQDDMLYVFMGNAPTVSTSTVLFAPINPDGTLGAWSQTTAYPHNLYNFDVTSHNGRFYVGGGADTVTSLTTSTAWYAPSRSGNIYWGLSVPGGQAAGSYTGSVTYTAVYSP